MKQAEEVSVQAASHGTLLNTSRLDQLINKLEQNAQVAILPSAANKLRILLDGPQNSLASLHVVADFDMTLTKHWNALERNISSHGVLERGEHVNKEFAIHTRQLYHHYYSYEISTSIGHEEKTKLMIEWWTKAHEAMIAEGFTRRSIERQARDANMQFRAGVKQLIDLLDARRVPLLIFSAGIGDVIEALLRVNDLSRPKQAIVSNKMRFSDEHGSSNPTCVDLDALLIGFQEPLVHSLNKGERVVQSHSTLSQQIHERRQVILLGDSPGDAQMAAGAQHDVVLKIGFFNFGDEARRREFEQVFDILVLGDSSMDPVIELLQAIESA
ncbi:pyrimidine 5'-nucleotidase-domain-containing protein [Protomyces lactucae-debilis]|uniref:5'-nucleotidase n=1 Tax=Protomyces lactucae-debilis TaxID=2754530 RepID=A0A1Y2F963_PROLT|nr:pyrimidine 5'-nucleotidase-domain-containing protein [Protomyces lactucae-debilis]ORY80441.1 pyrimidine 5'-nucleotidase-domain-containing protein [Protomyces lactucae-debilis]